MAKVMLVEDDNNLREIYEARLLAEGYEIISAQDGEEALALAVREKPDLIISDVMMPKISGFDMLDILRGSPETQNTKVIMMTALSQIEDKDRADKLGADRYLVKSQVTLEDVVRVAREVLEGTAASPSLPEPTPLSASPATSPMPEPVVAAPPADNTVASDSSTASTATDASAAPANDDTAGVAADNTVPTASDVTTAAAPEPQLTSTPVQAPEPPTTAEPVVAAPEAAETGDTQPMQAAEPAVAAAPEPIAAPEPVAQPAEETNQAAALEVVEKELEQAQTSEAEQQTVQQQISEFEKSDVTPPPIEVDEEGNISSAAPAEPAPTAAPEGLKLPDAELPAETKEEPVSAPEIAVPPVPDNSETQPAQPAEPTATADTQPPAQEPAVGGQKVIQPLHDPAAAPDLNTLAAKEEEKEKMAQVLNAAGVAPAAAATPDVNQAPAATESAAAEPKADDPNAIAL